MFYVTRKIQIFMQTLKKTNIKDSGGLSLANFKKQNNFSIQKEKYKIIPFYVSLKQCFIFHSLIYNIPNQTKKVKTAQYSCITN